MENEEKGAKLITLGVLEYFLARLDLRYQHQEAGKGLSQNDFTNELKSKLEHIDPDLFATADEVDEVLDQYFPGDVDPDIPPNDDDSGEEQQDTGNGEGDETGNGETIDAGAAEGEVTGDGADLDGLD